MEPDNKAPVFFLRDAIQFGDFIHSQRRLPATNLRSPTGKRHFVTEALPGVESAEDPEIAEVLTPGLREDDRWRERPVVCALMSLSEAE